MKALFTNRSWFDWFGPWVVLPVALLILWEAGVRAFGVDQRIVPAPSSVFVEMIVKAPLLASHAVPTLSAIFIGFIMSAIVGVLLGALLASSKLLDAAIFPLLIFSQAVPKIAIAPLLMIWFGFGIGSKVLVSFLMAFFAVLMDTMVGIKAMPPELLQLARSMGAREMTIFAKFRLPYALPYIFGGLRVASVFAVTGTVVAEFVGAENGLVYLMLVAQSSQQTSLVFAIVIILSVISIAMFEGVELIESRVVPWYRYRHAVAA
jgi:NitT/TauT family transport system permease protein